MTNSSPENSSGDMKMRTRVNNATTLPSRTLGFWILVVVLLLTLWILGMSGVIHLSLALVWILPFTCIVIGAVAVLWAGGVFSG
jgi:hypothetical protein